MKRDATQIVQFTRRFDSQIAMILDDFKLKPTDRRKVDWRFDLYMIYSLMKMISRIRMKLVEILLQREQNWDLPDMWIQEIITGCQIAMDSGQF